MTQRDLQRSVATLASLAFATGCALTQFSLPTDAGGACGASITTAEVNAWFESGSASLNGAVRPANSVTFPNVPNCSFYKWSEQMFLWLTSPAPPRYGGGGGLVMNTPAFFDVSLPDASGQRHFEAHSAGVVRAFNVRTAQRGVLGLPIVLQARTLRLLEVLPPVLGPSGRPLVQDAGGNEAEVADIRTTNEGAVVLLDSAGRDIRAPRALLRSKSNPEALPFERRLAQFEQFDRSSLVQKLVLNNRIIFLDLFGNFQKTEQGQADGGVLLAQNGSLVYYSLTVNNVFALFRSMQGTPVPIGTQFPTNQAQLNSVLTFATSKGQSPVIDAEALAVEIKASWVEAAGLADASQFIQMKAIVPTYDKTNPNEWVPNGTTTVTLAMVGMHVVGSAAGHPEMLWATFEHVSNAPNAEFMYTKLPAGTTTVPQSTTGVWVFAANGAVAPFNQMHMRLGGPANDRIVAVPGFSISPSNILRTMPWGLLGSNPGGNAEVISINNVVRGVLDAADVRRNYFHEGTTWTIFGASPNGSNQVGTNRLENTTMETFNQGANCFACHGSNTTAVSHVFNDTKPIF